MRQEITSSTKRVKAGTSKAAAAVRRAVFARAYLANGRNATKAAIAAGFSPKSAHTRGLELVKDREVAAMIDEAYAELSKITRLDQERTLQEIARLAYSDPRKLFAADGSLIPIHQLDDDASAAIANIEVVKGQNPTTRYRLWDKNAALEKAMKFHGLYERDNTQQREAVQIQVVLVSPPKRKSGAE